MKKNLYLLFSIIFLSGLSLQLHAQYYITTIAGNFTAGSTGDGGAATAAELNSPNDLSVDAAGNIFIADAVNNRIRKISTSGIITTIAGDGTPAYGGDGGPAISAHLNHPAGVIVDDSGNVFIGDTYNNCVRKVNTSGIITTIAGTGVMSFSGDGTPAIGATFNYPYGLALDSHHNLYIADEQNSEIRKLENTSGIISRFAGMGGSPGFTGDGGPATAAEINRPNYIITDAADNVYITDNQNQCIRKVNSTTHVITTIAGTPTVAGFIGDGSSALSAKFSYPAGIRFDATGNLYIADFGNNRIRMINTSGIISTIAGTAVGGFSGDGGPATTAHLSIPLDINFTAEGNPLIADNGNNRVRELIIDRAPVFTGGSRQIVSACDSGLLINSLLTVDDSDAGQTETTILVSGPLHGTVYDGAALGLGYSFTSTGSPITPLGGLLYLPTAGYTGLDSFKVVVNDSLKSDTTEIVVNVSAGPDTIIGTLTVCTEATITLTDAVTGGTWNSSVTSVATVGILTGIVTGVNAGVTDIIYTTACGSTTVTVTVNGPAAIAPSTPVTVCVGSTSTLTESTTFGTWSSGTTAVATVTGGVVHGISAGTAIISFTGDGGCSAIKVVTVNGVTPILPHDPSICIGGTVLLTNVVGGGTWISTNTGVATITSAGLVTGASAGIVPIAYIDGSCFTVFDTVTVTNGAGVITPATAIACVAQPLTLADASTGGAWSSGNTAVATVDPGTGIVTAVSGGTVTISYTLGSCYATNIVTVIPSSPITPITSSVCAGGTETLTEPALTLPFTGSWFSSNTALATVAVTSGIVTGIAPGTDTIFYQIFHASIAVCASYMATVNVTSGAGTITPSTAVSFCTGTTTTLADATSGGTWSSGNTAVATVSATGVVTGVSAGTVTIIYNLGSCSVSKIITIIAGAAAISPATAAICSGTTTTLTDATTGGVWTSSNSAVATVAAGTVGGISSGTSTISYTVGACSSTAIVTVNSSPGALSPAGTITLCSGATTTLTDATTGGAWSSGNTAVATVAASGVVSGVATGTATISYSIGSCAVTKTVTVIDGPGAISPSSPVVCTGTNVSLTDAVSGGIWSSTSTGVATVSATGVVNGVTAGTATISYLSGTCSATTTVTVVNAPAAIAPSSPVTICASSTFTLTDAVTGGSWSSSNTEIATVSSEGVVSGISTGTATITYTAGACFVTKVITISSGPASLLPSSPTVCTGTTLTLTDAVSGGTWSSSSTSTATVGATGIVSGVAAGAVNIYYIIGSCVATANVTVTASPSVGTISGTTSLCVGSTTPLTDVATGGAWSSSNTGVASVSATGVVSGISTGTATISYSATSSCGVVAATHVVTVNTTPSAGAIVGPTNICAGTVTTLTNTVTGGTWLSSNGAASVNITTGLLTGITPGTDTITYKVITPCGIASTTTIITVGTFLSAGTITGGSSLCGGGSITLTDGTTGGTWSSSNGSATVGSTGIVTGAATGGVDTISYTLTASCGSVVATHVVTINPSPDAGAISGVSSICTGTFVTLTESTTGGSWSVANTNATVTSVGVVTGVTAGTDVISYTTSSVSCGTATATFMVNISATVTAGTITGAGSVCPGSPVTLSESVGGGVWSSSGNATVSSSGLVTGVTAGAATISYTVTGSCGTAVATFPISVSSSTLTAGSIVGVSSLCAGSFTIFTDAAGGGIWSSSNSHATITSGGVVTGVSIGVDTISYTVTNSCGTAVATQVVNISGTLTAGTITGAGNVCIGFPVTLTESIGGGLWSASNGHAAVSDSGLVTGISSGMDTVYYTVTTGCGTATASFVISVNSTAPSAGSITGGAGACIGYPVLYTNAIAGGVWTVSNAHASISSTGLVTGVTAGTDTIRYTVSTPCGTASATKIITIGSSAGVSPIAGSSTVCTGYSITLTDATPSGVWSSSAANATVSGSGVVSGVTTGTAVISYSVTYSCGLASVLKNITVNPSSGIASISGPATVCQGATITLSEGTTGGVWTSGNGNATVSSTGVVTGIAAGTTPISYTLSSGTCGSISAVSIITIAPGASAGIGPISSLSIVCVGSGITLTDPTPGGVWLASNGHAVVVGAGIIDGVSPGVDTISYVVTGSCGSGAAIKILSVDTIPVVAPITGPTSQCVGTTITLSDPTAGGVWTTSTPSVGTVGVSTGVVTGVSSGITTLTYTVTNLFGCPGSVTTTDAVTPSSILTGITGSGSVCAGAATTLSNATAGGTWSSSNTAVAVIDPVTGSVTGVTPGTTTISYTVTNSCGTSSVTSTELVNAMPSVPPITGSATGCVGSAVTLSDGTAGGVWSSGDAGIATVDPSTGAVTGVTSGVVTINYTVSSVSGCSLSVSTSVFINPAPSVAAITGTASECAGGTTTLSDGTGGGLWSSSNTAIATVDASGTVTGITPGTTTIIYSILGSGCPGIATVTDVVNTIPVESAITGVLHVCAGAGTLLGNSIPGGVWSTANGAVAVADATSGIITGVSAGTVEIYYSVSNSCGAALDSALMAVYPSPSVSAIMAAYTTVCTGNAVDVSDAVAGGVWVTSNTAIATVNSAGIVTGLSAGTDTIYYVVTNGSGCSASAMLSITVGGAMPSASVVPSSTTSVCQGHSVFMHVVSAGGISYQWLRNGIAIPGATASGYTATATGNYTVIIGNGICSETLTGPSVVAPPVPVITFDAPDLLYTGTYASYQWFRNGILITGANSNMIHETGGGAYTVVVTDVNGCSDTSVAYTFGGPSSGVNGVNIGQDIKVYPNPAASLVHIDAPVKVNVSVLSIDGKVLIAQKNATDIDISSLADGMYMIMVYDESGLLLKTAKFAKVE